MLGETATSAKIIEFRDGDPRQDRLTAEGATLMPANPRASPCATAGPASFTLADVTAALPGHVIGRARLDGTYEIS